MRDVGNDAVPIWQAIVDANRAWMRGDAAATAALFAPGVIAVPPTLGDAVRGQGAMVQSFADYVVQVKTHRFEEKEHSIEIIGDTAVATYRFEVRYEIGGQTYDEVGQEVLVLHRLPEGWRVVWRTQVPVR
jgi:ketosteroid isomerase-like protein